MFVSENFCLFKEFVFSFDHACERKSRLYVRPELRMAAPQLRRCKIAIPVLPVVSESAPLVSTSLAASGTAESMLSPHSAAHAEVAKARYAASKEKEKERLWAGAKRKHDSDGDDPADDNYEEDADRTSTESDDDPEVEEDEEEPSDVDSDSSSSSKQRRKKAKSKGRGKGKGKGKGKAKPLVLRGTKHLHVPSVTAVTSTVAAATVMAARAAGAAFSTAGGAIGPAGAVQATTPFSVPAAAAAAASPSSMLPYFPTDRLANVPLMFSSYTSQVRCQLERAAQSRLNSLRGRENLILSWR